MTPEPETARFHALCVHFRAEGACFAHAIYGAISVIEREAGRPAPEQPTCKLGELCWVRLKTAWASRPRVAARRALVAVEAGEGARV